VFKVNVLTVLDVSMIMGETASEGCVKMYATDVDFADEFREVLAYPSS